LPATAEKGSPDPQNMARFQQVECQLPDTGEQRNLQAVAGEKSSASRGIVSECPTAGRRWCSTEVNPVDNSSDG
jgi:hypothetical protein